MQKRVVCEKGGMYAKKGDVCQHGWCCEHGIGWLIKVRVIRGRARIGRTHI